MNDDVTLKDVRGESRAGVVTNAQCIESCLRPLYSRSTEHCNN